MSWNITQLRSEFPILHQQVNGKPLVYLDNGATTQKHISVIEATDKYYRQDNANVHRAVHTLSERSTADYEKARLSAQAFLNAKLPGEVIFTKGTTDAINLVASSYGRIHFKPGDEIILSGMEHHSNIVPWQLIAEQTGAVIKVIPVTDSGELDLGAFHKLLSNKTKFVSLVYVSNTLGTINPVRQIIEAAHQKTVPVLLDAAQAGSHIPIDAQELDVDFLALSGHKMYGPTGVGILYGKAELLEAMPPYQGGGDMISSVTFAKTTYNKLPYKFEAGTPNIAGVIGLGAAVEFLRASDLKTLAAHEDEVIEYALNRLKEVEGLRIIGNAKQRTSAISFFIDGTHPYDVGSLLDLDGIAVRTGHHCTQPLMERFGLPATIRASFACYNTKEEVDALVVSLDKAKRMLR